MTKYKLPDRELPRLKYAGYDHEFGKTIFKSRGVWMLDADCRWVWGYFFLVRDGVEAMKDVGPKWVTSVRCIAWMYGKKSELPTQREAIEAVTYSFEMHRLIRTTFDVKNTKLID